jgi:nucleotide-binding universal stress UspA family protein
MGLKDLLVHVNVSKHCRTRLEIATRLAKAFDAHLTGLYTSAVGDVPFFMMEEIGANIEPTMRGWWLQMRDKVKAEFDAFLRGTGVTADWIEVEDNVAATVPYHARYADLTIVGQIDPEELLPRPEYEIPEAVALDSGRPVLVIPYAGTFTTLGQKVLVAWNGSAQSARAVNDAFPFLRRAESVTILTINPESVRKSKSDRPGQQIAAHLSRHGIKVEPRELAVDTVNVDDAILSQAADEGADLIVMGAYGHPRAREIVLGGATRALFKDMTVPIFMSH